MPKPKKDETQESFVSRFMSDNDMEKEYPDMKQRLAIAYQEWRDRNKKEDDSLLPRGHPLEIKKYENINFKPTDAMANNAKRALEVRKKKPPSQRGMTSVGLKRASQLINKETLSPETVRRMYSFFSRHEIDKQSSTWQDKGKGWQAWMGWGGDAGFAWCRRLVQAMDKEDNKKGINNSELTQDYLNSLEKKEFEFEIKEVNEEKGYFIGTASPFNNIDDGDDMVLSSVVPRNQNKKVPFLLQHTFGTEHGELILYESKNALMCKAELYMHKLENGNPIFPEAYRTHIIAKKGMLKLSIGYKTLDREYKVIDGRNIRLLKDIDIKEVSRVTVPMNKDAIVNPSEVKSIHKRGDKMSDETKAMDMQSMMAYEDADRKMNQMVYAFKRSNYNTMMDPAMAMPAKMEVIRKNCAYILENYPRMAEAYMKMYHGEDGMMKKEFDIELESKEFEDIESKAGAKIGKETRSQMMKAYRMMEDAMKEFKAMISPEMQQDPEKVKDPEGKKEDENIEVKSSLNNILNDINQKIGGSDSNG